MGKTWTITDRDQLHKKANEQLDQNLVPGEEVKVIIRGPQNSALIGTDRRAFVFKKGIFSGAGFGSKLASWEYKHLTGVQLETGMLTGAMSLQGPGIESGDQSYWNTGKNDPWKQPHALGLNRKHFDQAKEGVAILRQLIADAQQPVTATASAQPDIADQIQKLAQLKEAGVLTTEEFETKKSDLLARM